MKFICKFSPIKECVRTRAKIDVFPPPTTEGRNRVIIEGVGSHSFCLRCTTVYFVMVSIGYIEGEPETYVLPLAVACGERLDQVMRENPQAVVARLQHQERQELLYKAISPEDISAMEKWAHFWHFWVSTVFLQNYFAVAGQGGFVPSNGEELQVLLDACCLEKAIYELGYELNNRPDWVKIPLRGILQLLETTG
ncbi:MAG: hypothetical protein JRI57_04525 [Deltaproteobacteria bacterium]|nr:hypothetical protein [Deltaproteobacteria bacterium]MBW1987218.1 hypothetical protein [Deltaproteobacteria bacterium]MBW2134302.1 hypothetical protein [Deltaproteobacteria bacterium]